MPELERMLSTLGDELDWPPAPDLTAGVMGRLAEQPARRRPARGLAGLRRSLALAAVGLLVLAGAVYAAVPDVRDAVRDFLGLEGATVERRETLPTPPPERPLDLGSRMTLAGATERAGFTPLVPAALGEPDGVYLRSGLPGGEVSLTYRSRPGLPKARATRLGALLSEFRGDLDPGYLTKLVGPGTTAQRLSVDGDAAIWIEGAPHFLVYRGPDGEPVESMMRVAQNALLLQRGRLLIRLEGAFGRARAVAIARSLR